VSRNVKFLITGHSRGAAVGNLLSAKLNDTYNIQTRVFSYDFATPPVIRGKKDRTTNYPNIFCIDNEDDSLINNKMLFGDFEQYGVPIVFKSGKIDGVASGGHRPELYQKWVYEGLPDVISNWNN